MSRKTFAKVYHSLLDSEKVARLVVADDDASLRALGAWLVLLLRSTQAEHDGRANITCLREFASAPSIASAVASLVECGLCDSDGVGITIASFAYCNRTAEEIESTRLKRSAAGKAAAVARWGTPKNPDENAIQCDSDATPCDPITKKCGGDALSVSASVSVSVSDPDQGSDLGLLPTAPVAAKVRGALVKGYRDAFEAEYKTLPTDIRPTETDGAVFAIQARADVTGQDPVAIAARVAGFWIAQRPPWNHDHRKLPRWKYFLSDIGAMLTQVESAEVAQ